MTLRPKRLGSKSEVISTIRGLFRAVSIKEKNGSREHVQHILQEYRQNQKLTDKDKIRRLRTKAEDMLTMLNGIAEKKHLWALDAGVETKLRPAEIVSKSARRVGLQLPTEFVEDQEKEMTQ